MTLKEIFYDWGGYNAAIFHAINGSTNETLQNVMIYISMLGHPRVFIFYILIIAAYAYYDSRRHKAAKSKLTANQTNWLETISTLTLAYYIDLVWVHFLKAYFYYPRPGIAMPASGVVQLVSESHYSSFPSGHTCFAMLMVAGLWQVLNPLGKIIAVAYLIAIALSRIVLGVHFPADVVIGAALSLISVCLVRKLVSYIVEKPARQ